MVVPASLLVCCTSLICAGIVVFTVKLTPLLAWPPTVTTTFPVVAPLGTGATMLVGPQLVGVVAAPLNVTVLVPCVAPKFVPAIVTDVLIGPDAGVKLVMITGVTVKLAPLLGLPPTVTNTPPVLAPVGTGPTMLVSLQLVGVVGAPLKVTLLVPCRGPNPLPAIVTDVPIDPKAGPRLEMLGITTNGTALLATPPTVTTTLPVSAPGGKGVTMVLGPQEVGVAETPLNETTLVPCVVPKPPPLITTDCPSGPEVGLRFAMPGNTVKGTPLLWYPVPPRLKVTVTLPVTAAEGTGTTILVSLQLVGVPTAMPLNARKLAP